MLTIDPDKVCHVIIKARVFDAAMPDDDDDPGSDLAVEEVEDIAEHEDDGEKPEDDTNYEEVLEFISDLNEDEQIDLVALAWLGRGSFSREEWADAVEEARRAHNDRTAEYLLGMPLIADYLEEGLNAFGHSCDE